ncbi:MAG: hypothetical protein L6R48_15285, partial [Planctomycetes bacterium]|nr:hypothetical protein [Planctomycetota bacterium]
MTTFPDRGDYPGVRPRSEGRAAPHRQTGGNFNREGMPMTPDDLHLLNDWERDERSKEATP